MEKNIALAVVVKLVTDAHCAEKSLNSREFIFLEDFHRRFTVKLISNVVMKMSIQSLDLRFAMRQGFHSGLADKTCIQNLCDFQKEVTRD